MRLMTLPLQQSNDPLFAIIFCLSMGLGVLIYFIPSIIAVWRHHPSTILVIILNLLFGWTVVGWIATLIYSFMGQPDPTKSIFFR